jgi:hypothetical protein
MVRWFQAMMFVSFAFLLALGADLLISKRVALQMAGTYMLIGVVATICLVVYSEATTGRLFRRVSA